jgi:hypothetical protein
MFPRCCIISAWNETRFLCCDIRLLFEWRIIEDHNLLPFCLTFQLFFRPWQHTTRVPRRVPDTQVAFPLFDCAQEASCCLRILWKRDDLMKWWWNKINIWGILRKAVITCFKVLSFNFLKKPQSISTSSSDYIWLINTKARGPEAARKNSVQPVFILSSYK